MKKLLLIGSGGHAKSVLALLEDLSEWSIHGLIGLPHEVGSHIFNYPVIGTDSDLQQLRSECDYAFLCIGQVPKPGRRVSLAAHLTLLHYSIPTLCSRHAVVSRHASVGPGCFIGHHAVVNAGAKIGQHCIINSKALIEHDVYIGEFSHVSTGAMINGSTKIGRSSFIGSGSMLREGLSFGDNTIISAGQTIMKS